MYARIKTSILFVTIWLLTTVSCANASDITVFLTAYNLNKYPMRKPSFIGETTYFRSSQNGKTTDQICISLNGEALWEPGDWSDDKNEKYWQSHVILTIDGNTVPSTDMTDILRGGAFFIKEDKEHKQIGSYSVEYKPCFQVNLQKKLHIANVVVSTTSGKIQSYSWSFQTH